VIAIYLSAFSSLAAIKLFLEMPKKLEIFFLKCPKTKLKSQGGGKYKNWCKLGSFFLG
jgi:hypothetical protein